MSGILPIGERLFAKAHNYREKCRHDLAVGVLRQAAGFARSLNQFREIHVALADSYAQLGRFRLARKHLKVALSGSPSDADLHARLGQAWDFDELAGDSVQAIRHLRKAVNLDPTQPNHLRNLGRALLGRGSTAAGLRRLEQAWMLAPDEFARLEELVDALIEYGQLKKAERVLIRARFRLRHAPGFAAMEHRVKHARLARRLRQQRWTVTAGVRPTPAVLPLLRLRPTHARHSSNRSADGVILRLDPKAPDRPRPARRAKTRQRISD